MDYASHYYIANNFTETGADVKKQKEKELKEKYNMDDKKRPTKTEPIKQKSKWEDMGFGKAETNKG